MYTLASIRQSLMSLISDSLSKACTKLSVKKTKSSWYQNPFIRRKQIFYTGFLRSALGDRSVRCANSDPRY